MRTMAMTHTDERQDERELMVKLRDELTSLERELERTYEPVMRGMAQRGSRPARLALAELDDWDFQERLEWFTKAVADLVSAYTSPLPHRLARDASRDTRGGASRAGARVERAG